MRRVGDASADPTETMDHYDSFAFWAAEKILAHPQRLAILDVGSKKIMNAVLSARHDVTSLVLADCNDHISRVRYRIHDVADPLPFGNACFDVFTSMVSLPLVGLARYGDKLDPDCIPNLIAEISRVLRPEGEILASMCLGRNVLNFNNGWFFELPILQRLFAGWQLVDYLVDNWSSPKGTFSQRHPRFTKDTSVAGTELGDYRVIFMHLKREGAAREGASKLGH